MSALTKFSVTGVAAKRAAAARPRPAGRRSAPAAAARQRQRRRHQRRAGSGGGSFGASRVHGHPIEMTDRAPSRRPMMFSRLESAASSTAAGARLAAKAHAGRAPGAAADELQRAVGGGQRQQRRAAAGGVAGQGDAVAAEGVERGQARRHGLELEVELAVERASGPATDSIVKPGDASRARAAELQRVPRRAQAAEPGARPLADPAGAGRQRSVAVDAAEAGRDLQRQRAVEAAGLARGAARAPRAAAGQRPLEAAGQRSSRRGCRRRR